MEINLFTRLILKRINFNLIIIVLTTIYIYTKIIYYFPYRRIFNIIK